MTDLDKKENCMGNVVSLVRISKFDKQEIKGATYKALDALDFQLVKSPKKIAIKVNLCYYWDYSTGETTDPRVVSAIVDYIRDRWNNKAKVYIVESDASAVRMKHAFRMLGYEKLASEKGVYLSNLSGQPSDEVTSSVNKHTYTFHVPRTISSADIFISVPKLKIHGLTVLSCSLKNQFGCNPERQKFLYHPQVNEVIVALNKLMKPNIVLVDGIIALGKQPKKIGLLLAGTNPLNVDFVAAKIMNFNPFRIRHIQLASEEKIGDVKGITTVGEDVDLLKNLFPSRPSKLARALRKAFVGQMKLLYKLYLSLTHDIPPNSEKLYLLTS